MTDLIKIRRLDRPDHDQPRQWRSPARFEGDAAAEAAQEAVESPNGQRDSELQLTRRGFMGTAGFTMAAAASALSGCIRKSESFLVPYDKRPEDYIPGKPVYFATASKFGGQVLGLLVESQDGRPTKIEGNPRHPGSLGGTTSHAQASVMDLYDPDRPRVPAQGAEATTWSAFDAWAGEHFGGLRSLGGKGLGVLLEDTTSPTLQRLVQEFRSAFPQAKIYRHDLLAPVNRDAGTGLVGLRGVAPRFNLRKAEVVLSLDADFLGTDGETVRLSKEFAAGRRLNGPDDAMNRLYVAEPGFSITGMSADNRIRMKSALVGAMLQAIAHEVLTPAVLAGIPGADAVASKLSSDGLDEGGKKFALAVAKDLAGRRGRTAVIVGERQPAHVHALAHLVNVALGNVGQTVGYVPRHELPAGDLAQLTADAGELNTLLVLGGNPVYSGGAASGFAEAFATIEQRIHLTLDVNETSAASTWTLPASHYLESWGDHRAADGTVSMQQPLIEPLFGTRSGIELLAGLTGGGTGLDEVRNTWSAGAATAAFERSWRRWLHEGIVADSAATPIAPALVSAPVVEVAPAEVPADGDAAVEGDAAEGEGAEAQGDAPAEAPVRPIPPPHTYEWSGLAGALPGSHDVSGVEVNFVLDYSVLDGRYANNPWLQELPDPLTKLGWDNAALISPKMGRAMGISARGGVALPAEGEWVEPDLPHEGAETDMLTVKVGGRTLQVVAHVVPGIADDTVVLALGWGRQTVGRFGEGTGFDAGALRTGWFLAGGEVSKASDRYPISTSQDHHVMVPRAGYESRPLVREATMARFKEHPDFVDDAEVLPGERLKSLWESPNVTTGQQWGLSIDLNTCTGCATCVVACQAENNISVVGKERLGYGREMHWIRIDRYFTGESLEDPQAVVQPIPCMQCETAPCEGVCPVAATSHSPDGLNDMAYNRCIGTRYCANNCPFKVRRFNYFAYAKENDTANELAQWQKNPDVTVRFRGVIEKCTYCVQRINAEKIEAKAHGDGVVPDGRIIPACAQACPTDSIVFGDIRDPNSLVAQRKLRPQEYVLLSELNIHPRTSYGARLRNPNPDLASHAEAPAEAHGEHH